MLVNRRILAVHPICQTAITEYPLTGYAYKSIEYRNGSQMKASDHDAEDGVFRNSKCRPETAIR